MLQGCPVSPVSTHVESGRPMRTVYMDGVFDLFHVGHLEAVQQCQALGDRVIIGVCSDTNAATYNRLRILDDDA